MRPFFLWDEKFIQHCEWVYLWTLLKPAALIRSRSVLENPHNKINKTLKSVTDHRMRLLWPIRRERAWNIAQSLQEEARYPRRRDSASLRCIFIVNYILPQVMSKWQILLSGCEEARGDVVIAHGILAKRGFFNLFPSRQFHLARCEADAWRVRLHR